MKMQDINKTFSTDYILEQLLRHLSAKHLVTSVSKEFSALEANAKRVDFLYNLLDQYSLFPAVQDLKSNDLATKMREKGNEMFKARKNETAIELYTQSIALAEQCSEQLALAYANRSAVLFEKEFYEQCLEDIDRALGNSYPQSLKPKLLTRQEKANQMRTQQVYTNYFEKIPGIPENHNSRFVQCAADSIEINHSTSEGRHVIATRDITAGEVIAIEKPFSQILITQYYNHCHDCLKVCYNLIPCERCTQTLYCSEQCRADASYYHRYECRILATLRKLEINKLKLLPLKITLQVKKQYPTIKNMYKTEEELYRSDRYKEIHNLIPNTSGRSVSDLFDRSTTSAVIFYLIKTFSDFFQNEEDEEIFKELVLLHMQTSACNFHEISELSLNQQGLYEPDEIGAGAYSFLSMFNHRCSPNVLRNCYGPVIVVRAIETIKKGEQCYDNYGYHHALMDRHDRKEKLKKQYFFDCTCEVCKTDWPLYTDLPEINTGIHIRQDELLKLQNGDIEVASTVLMEMLPKIKEVEKEKPNRNLAEMQEIIKQCFALLGNVRRAL